MGGLEGFLRPQVHHFQRPGDHHIGDPHLRRAPQPLRTHRVDASRYLVRQLGGRDIQDRAEMPLPDHFLHDLPAGRPPGMEKQDLIPFFLQQFGATVHTGGCDTEAGNGDSLFILAFQRLAAKHAVEDGRRLPQNVFREKIQVLYVHHRVYQQQVLALHIRQGVAGGHGGHDNLRHA